MRVFLKASIVVSMLFLGMVATASNGNPKPALVVKSVDSEKFVVTIDTSAGDVEIEFKDNYGTELYSDALVKGFVYKKTYVLYELPEGLYYMKIKNSKTTKVYKVQDGKVELVVSAKNNAIEKRREQLMALMA